MGLAIVGHFNGRRAVSGPYEADAELIVNRDRVLFDAVVFEGVDMIAGKFKVGKRPRTTKGVELTTCDNVELQGQGAAGCGRLFAVEDVCRCRVPELYVS